jgi:hypothetical protein
VKRGPRKRPAPVTATVSVPGPVPAAAPHAPN